MSSNNLPYSFMGEYVESIQKSVLAISQIQQRVFLPDGSVLLRGDLSLGGNNIYSANSISVKTLHYTTLDPPIATGGNISGPVTSTNHALVRYGGTTGQVVLDSPLILEDDGKLISPSGTIDLSTPGSINLSASLVTVAGYNAVTSVSLSATDSDIAVFAGTSGYSVKTSGISVSSIANKLPLAGGTMSGNIVMAGNSLTGVLNIAGSVKTSAADALVTSSAASAVDSDIAVFDATTGKIIKSSSVQVSTIATKLPLAGGTMSGSINLGANNLTNIGSISGSVKTSSVDALVTSSAASAVDSDIAVFDSTTGKIIKNSSVQVSQIANKLPLAGGTMSGNIAMGNNSLTGVLNISGATKTSAADALVTSSAASAVDSDIAIFDSTTGKIIKNSSVQVSQIANKLPLAGGTMSGAIAMAANNITNVGTISGATNSRSADNIVSNAGSSTSNNIAIFSGTSGKIITDSGSNLSQYALLSGATFTGAIAMGANNITGTGSISAGSISVTNTTAATNPTTGALLSAGGLGVAGKIYSGNNVVIGAVQTIAIEHAMTLRGANLDASLGPHIGAYTGSDQYPVLQMLNYAHDNINMTFDAYFSSGWKSSYLTSNYQISKQSDALQFNVSPGATAGSAVTWTTAGFINTSGILQWNKAIKITDATLSSSTTTGCLILTGGIGVAGAMNIAGTITAAGSISGPTNSRTVDNIVSNNGSGVVGNIVTIANVSGKIVQDSGTALSSLATNAGVAAAYLALTGGTVSGSINLGANNLTNVGSISGATKTSAADALVTSSAASAVDSDIAVFDSTTGKIIKNSSVQVGTIATKLPLAGGTMSGAIAMATNNITNVGTISGATNSRSADNIVSNAGSSVSGNVATFSGASGKIVQDGGVALSALATNSGMAATYLALAGGTMTGAISMSGNNISGVGALTTNTLAVSGTGASTSPTTGSVTMAGDLGINGLIRSGNSVIIGPTSALAYENRLTLYGSNASAAGPHIVGYTALDTYPIYQIAGMEHNDIAINFDAYWDGTWRSSSAGSNYTIHKKSNELRFLYNSGTTPGAVMSTMATAGSINSSGILQWQKQVQITDTTASTSAITGAFVVSGGIGASGSLFLTGSATIPGSLAGSTNTRSVDNIVSNAGTGVSGNVATFSGATGKIIQDGGTALSALATNANVSATYLAKSGGTMTGAINMGGNQLTNLVTISADPVNDNNVIWGTGTTLAPPGNNLRIVTLGYNHLISGYATTSIGDSNTQTVGAGNCIMIGSQINITGNVSAAVGNVISMTGDNNYAFGDNNTINASNAFIFGRNGTNSTTNSVLFGDANVVNLRPNGNITCDLGTSTSRFKNAYFAGGIYGASFIDLLTLGPITIGGAIAGTLTLGRSGQLTTCAGIFNTTVSIGKWYSITTYNPSFSAGVNRLTPPTTATAGTLSEFTYAAGVLTYTGARLRNFVIDYDITFLAGASGAHMTFFNSINASTVLTGTVQAQARRQVNASNANTFMHCHLTDIISLATNNTVQLAAACATASTAVGFQLVSCKIRALVN